MLTPFKTIAEMRWEVKDLTKKVNCGEDYFLPQLNRAKALLAQMTRNGSFAVTPRSANGRCESSGLHEVEGQ